MKHILRIIILMLVLHSTTIAQTPEPIYSFAKVRMGNDWYKQQQKLWKAEIDKSQSNANAWYNYFKVSRILTRLDGSDKRTPDEKTKYLNGIAEEMGKVVPNTFEYNHVMWIASGLGDMTKLSYLQKAIDLSPNNPVLCSDVINLGELNRDMNLRDKYAKLWFTSGQASLGFLNYSYNVMAGLKENAIIVTAGDNDTYYPWIIQAVMGFRRDITVINTSLILIKEYREKLFKELGVPQITYDPFQSPELMTKFNTELITVLANNKSNKPVYAALTASLEWEGEMIEKHTANLYLTGLAYEYSIKTIDNIAILKKNFEQMYALDYLDKYFAADISIDLVKRLNLNYVVPMVKLYEHYMLAGETQKAEVIKNHTLKLVEGTEDEAEVKKIFKK